MEAWRRRYKFRRGRKDSIFCHLIVSNFSKFSLLFFLLCFVSDLLNIFFLIFKSIFNTKFFFFDYKLCARVTHSFRFTIFSETLKKSQHCVFSEELQFFSLFKKYFFLCCKKKKKNKYINQVKFNLCWLLQK